MVYLMTQSTTNIATLALMRQFGISWKATWLVKHKLMEAIRSFPFLAHTRQTLAIRSG